jgi:hypothetical protein
MMDDDVSSFVELGPVNAGHDGGLFSSNFIRNCFYPKRETFLLIMTQTAPSPNSVLPPDGLGTSGDD